MDWKHGYFAESGYTYGYYPETSPARLRWAALLKGIKAPSSHFRYLDLGCGQGLNLILMAANHPDSEFVGIDFMPEHVAHGRALAESAGLSNVRFIEGDFIQLAEGLATLESSLGTFDYAVAHGITTWIAPAVREALFKLAGSLLKPSGLMYNSYNTYPGWLPASPFQHLVMQLQQRYSGPQALQLAQQHMAALKESGSALYSLVPLLDGRLDNMKKQDATYLVQEYNNQYWQPVYCSQMLQLARQYKLDFAVSATLPEVFEGAYPPKLLAQINSETDPVVRETLRDLALGQSFRRDLYVKGALIYWSKDKSDQLLDQRFLATQSVPAPTADSNFEIKGGALSLNGKREAYMEVLDAFGPDGASLRQVQEALPKVSFPTLVQITSLLMHGGWMALDCAGGNTHSNTAPPFYASSLNAAIGVAVLAGAPYRYVALGRVQSAMGVSDLDLMLIGLTAQGVESAQLGLQLHLAMGQLGKRFVVEGKTLEDDATAKAHAIGLAGQFISEKLPNLKRLGAIQSQLL
ncbi:MAG: class I SAM-dependent methyltransferase [Limnobacter sp.]|nr:class I SAM-dependent methyltransferase [Limnobacter sp.]